MVSFIGFFHELGVLSPAIVASIEIGWGELSGTGAGVAWAWGLAVTLCLGVDIALRRRGARPVTAAA